MWKCGNMSSLSLSNNSGSVEICLQCLYLTTPKCGNVEMCLHRLNLLIPEVWKCGETPLHCLYPTTLAVWKSENLEVCLVCSNLMTLEEWKSGNVSGMIWELKIGLAHDEMTGVTSDCCQSQDSHMASFSSPPGRIFLLFVHR